MLSKKPTPSQIDLIKNAKNHSFYWKNKKNRKCPALANTAYLQHRRRAPAGPGEHDPPQPLVVGEEGEEEGVGDGAAARREVQLSQADRQAADDDEPVHGGRGVRCMASRVARFGLFRGQKSKFGLYNGHFFIIGWPRNFGAFVK